LRGKAARQRRTASLFLHALLDTLLQPGQVLFSGNSFLTLARWFLLERALRPFDATTAGVAASSEVVRAASLFWTVSGQGWSDLERCC
jgi:hypothetical protein